MRFLLGRRLASSLFLVVLLNSPLALLAADPEEDRQTLLRLHEDVLEAHHSNDLDAWMQGETDDYVMVSRGRVLTPDKETRGPMAAHRQRLQRETMRTTHTRAEQQS